MPKGGRGGKRGGGMGGGGADFSHNSVNSYQIPATAAEALGPKGAPLSMADAFFESNPFYSDNYAEFSQNCQRCVYAYEMRRRGYDVEALPTYKNDQMPRGSNWMTAMKGLTPVDVGRSTELATIKNIEKQMASWGEGSRAIIRVKWAGGNSGHVFNLEQANGKLHVYDAQSNQRVTGVDYLKKYLPYSTLSRTQLVRTDNAEIAENMRFMVKPKSK